jgi:mRNA interferase YafQ
MLDVRATSRFKKDVKKAERQGKPMAKLGEVVDRLRDEEELEPYLRDHALTGNYVDHRECHLSPDWLLIYKIEDGFLVLVRTGSHSELF